MSKANVRNLVFLLVVCVLAINVVACVDDPGPVVIEVISETQETVQDGVCGAADAVDAETGSLCE